MLTFVLIFIGGLVTTKGAGLSVPDWPNSYGYNMWFFPPSKWVGGILYEHLHRLVGTLVGFASIVLVTQSFGWGGTKRGRQGIAIFEVFGVCLAVGVCLLFRNHFTRSQLAQHLIAGVVSVSLISAAMWIARRREPRRWVRWLTVGLFVSVCIQGALGGFRVELISLTLAIVHGCFAQAVLAGMVTLAVVTARRWFDDRPKPATRALFVATVVALGCVTIQLVVGAIMRHEGAGLAVPGVLHYGRLLPPTNDAALGAANAYRSRPDVLLPPTTLEQIWLHVAHRVGAVLVTIAVGTAAVLWRNRSRGVAIFLFALLMTQLTLGVLTVYLRKPADIASFHVAGGATMLATLVALATRLRRHAAKTTPAELASARDASYDHEFAA